VPPEILKRAGASRLFGDSLGRHRKPYGWVIFEEFKGTGNMKLFDRRLVDRRVFPLSIFNAPGLERELLSNAMISNRIWL